MSVGFDLPTAALITDLSWCLDLSTAPTLRTMSQWVEDEIVLPNGPFSGQRYKHSRHPVSKVFFDLIDSGLWSRVAATGPTQNGKTLMCYVAPVLYHLFEIGETVIVGLPTIEMANDKWSEDFLQVIEATRYRELLPLTGEGSRGGQVKRSIKFRNGAALRFMTAGGNDKKRSAYTSRVVAITEVDGMDESSESSREADKVEQIEARTRAFGRTGKRIYLECTVSIERGRIWQEKTNGTDTKLVRKCPHCGEYVAPEREHLQGWQDAKSSEEAAELGHFVCPECSEPWSESDRIESWKTIVPLHDGQSIDSAGVITGDPKKTQTLGFRWSAIDNPFITSGDLGAEEWQAHKSRNRENAEKKMRQFVWTLPYESPEIELTPLDAHALEERTSGLKKGVVPEDCKAITIGIDTGKRKLHWTAIANGESGSRVIDYGIQPVESDRIGVRRGLIEALDRLAKFYAEGWRTASGQHHTPSQVWIDSGWHEHTDAVYSFCTEINKSLGLKVGSELYRPTKGYGEGQRNMTRYIAPDGKKNGIQYIGTQFHIATVKRNGKPIPGVLLVHLNSDHWKSELHQRLMMPATDPMALTLYDAASFSEHTAWTQHITAEKQIEKFVEGRGEAIVWERVDRNNHWLDSTYAALCAGDAVVTFGMDRKAKKERRTLQQMAGR